MHVHKHKPRFVIATAFAVFVAGFPVSADASSDIDLKQMLIGAWSPSSDSPNRLDALARKYQVYSVEEFFENGTGRATTYREKMCAEVAITYEYSWDIIDGVLITKSISTDVPRIPPGKESHDRIISIDEKHAVLFSNEHSITEYRDKAMACPVL